MTLANPIQVPNAEQYAKIVVRSVTAMQGYLNGMAHDEPGFVLLAIVPSEEVVQVAGSTWDSQRNQNVLQPETRRPCLLLVFGQKRDDVIEEMQKRAMDLNAKRAEAWESREEQRKLKEKAEQKVTELDALLEKTREDLKWAQDTRGREIDRAARGEHKLRQLETELGKLRDHFGKKACDEALK